MTEYVKRHAAPVRAMHWFFAVSGLLLCVSGIGFMPLYGRFYVNELPGLAWMSDFHTQMTLHYLSAAVFTATAVFHLLYHWRRREFAAWPKRKDFLESWLILRAMLTGSEEPPQGKFLAEQRLAYLAIGTTSLLLIATGLVLSWKNGWPVTPNPASIQWITLTHLAATFLFMALVALHLLAFLPKSNRPLLPTMFTGRLCRRYASKRHGRWFDSQT